MNDMKRGLQSKKNLSFDSAPGLAVRNNLHTNDTNKRDKTFIIAYTHSLKDISYIIPYRQT